MTRKERLEWLKYYYEHQNENAWINKLVRQRFAAERRAKRRHAMPAWADRAAIAAKYVEAKRLTLETGIPHHVDHYYPLVSNIVCGLHVAENLRVVPAVENLKKSNSVPEHDLAIKAVRQRCDWDDRRIAREQVINAIYEPKMSPPTDRTPRLVKKKR